MATTILPHDNCLLSSFPSFSFRSFVCSFPLSPSLFLFCDYIFVFVHNQCRCPAGYLETDDGRNCTSINELCKANPCLCRHGRHRLRQRIQESTSTDSFEPNGSAKLSRLFSDSNRKYIHYTIYNIVVIVSMYSLRVKNW